MDTRYNLDDITPKTEAAPPEREEIITTPLVEQAWDLFENCRLAKAMGVIQGPSGTGKTWALKAIQKRFLQAELPGSLRLIPCCHAGGPSAGVRAVSRELGLGGAVTSNHTIAGLQYVLKLAQREIIQRNITGLLLDDADNFAEDALGGIVSLFNHLREAGHPTVILLAGCLPEERWIAQLPAAKTRTLHIARSSPMPFRLLAGVLRQMGGPLPSLVTSYQQGDKEAGKILKRIHLQTGGVFRRVGFFAELAAAKAPEGLTLETAEAILAQMQN